MRAASNLNKDPVYHSDDFIAPLLLPRFVRLFINIIKKILAPRGIYEYVIARTKYIDSVFENAIQENCEQILIFGAGFDSRGIRLSGKGKPVKVFELDARYTQEAKLNQLKKRRITAPGNIVYIPIDFNKERLEDKLVEYGFSKNKKSLFILEGLIMYLEETAVDNTFSIIHKFADRGSLVVCDYIYASVLRKENLYYGEKNIHRAVLYAGEPWKFGIEKGEIEIFLLNRGFKLIEHLDRGALENRYFIEKRGIISGRINGTHCLFLAEKAI
jgi:methyltransferase (TIGR00027 family)